MASAPTFTLVLSDSTGYGWLPGGNLGGTALVVRDETKLVAAVVCSGSLVKPGTAGPCALDVVMEQWILPGGLEAFHAEHAVQVGIVPARESVPGRAYEGLQLARKCFGVPETPRTILNLVGKAYGNAKDQLHFKRSEASGAMDTLVTATLEDMRAQREVAATAEHRSAQDSAAEHRSAANDPWIAVVVCAGWNCTEKEILAESFVAARLASSRTWAEVVRVLSAHAAVKLPWTQVAPSLKAAPKILWQTCYADYPESARMMQEFASGLRRVFVDDPSCEAEVLALGGDALLARYRNWTQASHRADLWRYLRLHAQGGYYMDIKMRLLRPLEDTLREIYEEGNRLVAAAKTAAEGQRIAQPTDGGGQRIAPPPPEGQRIAQSSEEAGQRIAQPPPEEQRIAQTTAKAVSTADWVLDRKLEEQPHLIMSRGANQEHVFQGNILACSPEHPLFARAIADCMSATPAQMRKRYLRFCEFLWAEMKRDLGREPCLGWNFCKTLGPIYLFEERLHKHGKQKMTRATTSLGTEIPIDGHLMHIAHNDLPYAATRAWGWNKKFIDVAMVGLAVNKDTAMEQSIAQLAPAQSIAQPEEEQSIAQHSPGQSIAQLLMGQSIAQSPTAQEEAASSGVAPEEAEEEGMAMEVTTNVLQQCQKIVADSVHYSDLVEAEVATLVGLGLRPAVERPDFLSCVRCKNSKRKEYKFQGSSEVRRHFQGHDDLPAEQPEQTTTRFAASAAAPPETTASAAAPLELVSTEPVRGESGCRIEQQKQHLR